VSLAENTNIEEATMSLAKIVLGSNFKKQDLLRERQQ
jgi:hypothetical protein